MFFFDIPHVVPTFADLKHNIEHNLGAEIDRNNMKKDFQQLSVDMKKSIEKVKTQITDVKPS